MSEYKFFYDVKYFPIPSEYEKSYKITTVSVCKPDIVDTADIGIFEVKDNHLFYTNSPDKFNMLTTYFKVGDVKVRVVKYKKVGTSTYAMCVKTTAILPDVHIVNVDFATDILKPITFNMDEYCKLIDPVFLVKKDGTTVDLLAQNNNIYACFANYGMPVGKIKKLLNTKFFAKGELIVSADAPASTPTIYIFDAYIAGEILELPYADRMKKCQEFIDSSIEWDNGNIATGETATGENTPKIVMSEYHSTFKAAYDESQTMPNDGVIIQPQFGSPLKWKPAKQNTVDVLVEDDLYLAKGLDGILSFKVIPNRDFDRRLIGEYRQQYEGEIIEIDMHGHFHRIRHDKFKPNAVNTYKSGLTSTAVVSPDIVSGVDEKFIGYLFAAYKNTIMEKYVHGNVIEIGVDCGVVNKVQDLIIEDNFLTLTESDNYECKINNSTKQSAEAYLKANSEIDTIIIPNLIIAKEFGDILMLTKACMSALTDCGKIIFVANVDQKAEILQVCTKLGVEPLYQFDMKDAPNISFVNESIRGKVIDYNIVIVGKPNIPKPEFIFVVGLMGSGKSRFIQQIRNFIHPSTELNIINTDDLVIKYISYQLNSSEAVYQEVRADLDPKNDRLIEQLMDEKKSIVLETTRIDKDWAAEIRKSHKVIGIICNTTIEQIKSNIERRNVFNIRKTTFNSGQYREFQTNKSIYSDRVDELYEFDMQSGKFIRLESKGGDIGDAGDAGTDESIIIPIKSVYVPRTILKFDELTESEAFGAKAHVENPPHHYGQRKLLISEMMFLAMHADPDTNYNVIYAGSAPNIKFPVLYQLFPNCKFILIDPNPFHRWTDIDYVRMNDNLDMSEIIKGSEKRAFLLNELMSISVSEKLSGLSNILYISDIRTGLIESEPLDYDTIFNNMQNKAWIDILKPVSYMLKYRPAYGNDKPEQINAFLEMVKDIPEWKMYENKLDEFKNQLVAGDIFLQCWAGSKSAEIRIVGDSRDLVNFNSLDMEGKLYYYNTYLRKHPDSLKLTYKDIFGALSSSIEPELGAVYCGCNDCRIEAHWIKTYNDKYFDRYHIDVNEVLRLINMHSQKIANHKDPYVGKFINFKNNRSKDHIVRRFHT